MTLEEAIRRTQARVDGEFSIKGVDKCEDLKLLIEAGKRIIECRLADHTIKEDLLLGETEE